MKKFNMAAAGLLLVFATAAPATAAISDFSHGDDGWTGNGEVDTSLGNAAPSFHSVVENFGLSWRNDTNPAFVGDYTASPSVTIGIDVLTNMIEFEGTPVTRDLVLTLSDLDPQTGATNALVWYDLGTLSPDNPGWQHYSVTIADTSATDLPPGWGGDDGEGDLVLPPGRTFASVLANVDEISFSTYVPGYFYGFTDFDVAGDNISITRDAAVPEPASWALMIGGFGLVGGALRRARRAAIAA